jgi:succinylglutamic semialdehyde dehydrogenase
MKFHSTNPATGEIIWEGEADGAAEVDRKVQAAAAAFERWSRSQFEERLEIVERFRAALEGKRELLAETISKEVGKPLWDSRQEVASMIGKVALSVEAYMERTGVVHKSLDGVSLITRHRPLGVIAIFGPFNFPGHLPNGQMVPALIAGNCVLLKPSELTPHVGELILSCWEEAGLTQGEVQLVQGGPKSGELLSAHPGIQGLLFTGSARTGKLLLKQFSDHPEKLIALEMGGNNPLIVDNPCDPSAAVYHTLHSAFATSGQRCTCARRLIVPRSDQNERFVAQLVTAIGKIKVGPYTDQPEPFMGPVISSTVAKRLFDWQQNLISQGGKPLVPARLLKEGGAFLTPGLVDVSAVSDRPDEEQFGPILQLIWVNNFAEAIEEANRTHFGLAASLLSDDEGQWRRFLQEIRAGVVNWNRPTTGASGRAPFGGIGLSGNFRPAGYYMGESCCYPVASLTSDRLVRPETLSPGLEL